MVLLTWTVLSGPHGVVAFVKTLRMRSAKLQPVALLPVEDP